MKRTITTVLSAEEVAKILARHTIALREIEVAPNSHIGAEMMAVFEKDPVTQQVGVTQYRIEVTLDEVKESWRG
jgi:hypothetical protein